MFWLILIIFLFLFLFLCLSRNLHKALKISQALHMYIRHSQNSGNYLLRASLLVVSTFVPVFGQAQSLEKNLRFGGGEVPERTLPCSLTPKTYGLQQVLEEERFPNFGGSGGNVDLSQDPKRRRTLRGESGGGSLVVPLLGKAVLNYDGSQGFRIGSKNQTGDGLSYSVRLGKEEIKLRVKYNF